MAITINGDGTLTGISTGGLPDGIVDADMLATSAVATAKIADDAVTVAKTSFTGDLQFNSGYGSAATAYGVRAWINFDGKASTIGTGRASGNMDAVTDHGTGDYTVNFTTDMPDVNYAVFGASGTDGTTASSGRSFQANKTSPTVGSFRFGIRTTSGADFHADLVYVCIVR